VKQKFQTSLQSRMRWGQQQRAAMCTNSCSSCKNHHIDSKRSKSRSKRSNSSDRPPCRILCTSPCGQASKESSLNDGNPVFPEKQQQQQQYQKKKEVTMMIGKERPNQQKERPTNIETFDHDNTRSTNSHVNYT